MRRAFRPLLFCPLVLAPAALCADEPGNYTDKIPNSAVTFDMVHLAGGTFQMGSPDAEPGRDADEGPVHAAVVEPFWIGKYEVTWAEFEQFWLGKETPGKESADASTRPSAAYEPPDHGWGRDRNPALHLTQYAASRYCEWLTEQTGHTYRLPTEAEWEFACRGGTAARYSFGDDPAKLDEYAWYEKNGDGKSHPVGQKKPNPFGLYDMHGNVWEWCADSYTPDYQEQPAGDAKKKRFKPLCRGGSFKDAPDALRSANRQIPLPEWNQRNPQRPPGLWWLTDGEMCGFRLARSVKEAPKNGESKKEGGTK